MDPDDYGFRFKAGDEWYHIQVWSIIHRLDTETRLGVDRVKPGNFGLGFGTCGTCGTGLGLDNFHC